VHLSNAKMIALAGSLLLTRQFSLLLCYYKNYSFHY